MDESDLAWGLGLVAVTAAGVLVVLILVIGLVLLFRRLFWRRERIATGQALVADMRSPAETPATATYSRGSVWREQIPRQHVR
ncbi:hypothetical protein Bra1253DRAFT_07781 [Bradyrhizobium sp. WSM1253]|nr:hypothetical protein Bra1253DRAFT_07781 [Bradyrhizobium sp. WSM1253]